jgi:hypothetical protein
MTTITISPGQYWSVADIAWFTDKVFPAFREWHWPVVSNLTDTATGQVWFVFDVPVATDIPYSFYTSLKHPFTSLPAGANVLSLDPYKLGAFAGGPTPVADEDAIFEGGRWYTTSVPTEEYSQPKNPLDRAMSEGFVYLAQAANYGQSASWIWLKIYVKRNIGGGLGQELWVWGNRIDAPKTWAVVAPDVPPEQDIPVEDRGESPIFTFFDEVNKTVENLKPDPWPWLKPVLYTAAAVGAALLLNSFFTYATIREQRNLLEAGRRR